LFMSVWYNIAWEGGSCSEKELLRNEQESRSPLYPVGKENNTEDL
jgi:hypothetical protein